VFDCILVTQTFLPPRALVWSTRSTSRTLRHNVPPTGHEDTSPRTFRLRPRYDGRNRLLEHLQLLRHAPVALEQRSNAVSDAERLPDGVHEQPEALRVPEVPRGHDTDYVVRPTSHFFFLL